jgi:pimeloyl-ACP methyl ester carboxylesterase
MLKDSAAARLFIRVSILSLRAVAPLSISYCVVRLITQRFWTGPVLLRALDGYAAIESSFYFLVYLPRRIWLDRPAPAYCTLPAREERRKALLKTWECTPDPRAYVSLWFNGVPVDALCREDIKDFITWRLWNKTKRSLADEDELEEHLAETERVLDIDFPRGHSGNTSMAVTFEPLRMMHRPLLWYVAFVGGADSQMCLTIILRGYRFYSLPLFSTTRLRSPLPIRPLSLLSPHRSSSNDMSYWHLPHTSDEHLPILFIHAIGVGLHFYLNFFDEIRQLNQDSGIGMIALEILSISNRISPPFAHSRDMAKQIRRILDHHGWSRCMVVSHSYGSVIAAQILREPTTASLVGPLLFVDPVSFAFHDPQIAWNFLRRKPTTASEIQLQYFASMDPDVAYTLTRRFVWPENSLWREDMEERAKADGRYKCTIALAGRDIIIDTNTMGRYLTRDQTNDRNVKWYQEEDKMSDRWKHRAWTGNEPLEVMWFPELNHAEAFDEKKDRARLLDVIRRYCKDGARSSDGSSNADGRLV